jgi:DNA-directed RNA polymerase specialized sigma24 family protein
MDATGETVTDAQRTDTDLIEELRAGSPDALTTLFDLYGDRIHTHCFRQLGSWHEAEDATATVFLEVWRHRARVAEHDGSAVPWLYGVATNVCRNLNRSSRRRLRAAEPCAFLNRRQALVEEVAQQPSRNQPWWACL